MAKAKKPFIFDAWMISNARRSFRRYPGYYNTLNKARYEYTVLSVKGKSLKRVDYYCAKCKERWKSGEVVVDHIDPVVDPQVGYVRLPNGNVDWNWYLPRLYCSEDNLQVLCKDCHDIKTGKENKERRTVKKKTLQSSKK